MDLPDHPRVREIEAERRLRPIGMNCAINILRDGSRHVIPFPDADPNGPGTRQDKPYFSERPFLVTRSEGQPDIVRMALAPESSDIVTPFVPPPPTLLPFGFAMRFYWQYDEGSGWTDFGSPNPYYTPFPLPGTNRWSFGDGLDVNGSNLAVDGVPDIGDTPIRPVQDYPTDAAWEAGFFANAVDTDYRITEVRFFFGNVLTGPTDVPNATGTWNIVWDERPDDAGFPDTTTITATHTVGTFQMLGTEDPTDSTTWPVIYPSLSWSVLSTEQLWFNGLRIVRVS